MTGPAADNLNLRFPSDSSYLGISRLNATAVAAGAGFNVDELDDLRLAVGEAMAWLLRCGGDDALVDVRMTCATSRFELTAAVEGLAVCDDEPDDLVHAILGATVDHYAVEYQQGGPTASNGADVDARSASRGQSTGNGSGSKRRTVTLSKTAADA